MATSPTYRPFNIPKIPLRWNSKNSQGENRAEIHDTEINLGGYWLESLPWNWIQLGFVYSYIDSSIHTRPIHASLNVIFN